MLVEFEVENFRSIKEPVVLSMIASREQNHGERLPRIDSKYNVRINPVAGIYGANASGKSNVVRALSALRHLLIETRAQDKTLPYTPFALDVAARRAPTRYRLMFLTDGVMYEYALAHTGTAVAEESLTEIKSRTETLLFHRVNSDVTFGEAIEEESLKAMVSSLPKAMPLVSLLAPFRLGSVPHIDELTTPFLWCFDMLAVPAGEFTHGLIAQDEVHDFNFLTGIGAGIHSVRRVPVDPARLGIDREIAEESAQRLEVGDSAFFDSPAGRFLVRRAPDGLEFFDVRFSHSDDPDARELSWAEESDGTRDLMALFPFFRFLAQDGVSRVLIIDELDRSFHTLLTRELVRAFLNTCGPRSRSQLIFTTHDVLLMDLDLFRKDEIWVVEKNDEGASELIALSDYQGLRKDMDLRKSYLVGRFGGTPAIEPFDLSW